MTEPDKIDDDSAVMQQLRGILFAKESARITAIEEVLNNQELHAKEIAKILAEAVQLRNQDDDKLGKALRPAVEGALKASIAKDPKPLSDALFPVMGPAIRKSINHSIADMLQSLNQTLEHSFSAQGMQWRLDAFRTGKPFAEIVMLNTLVYRVEQVFLIHKETGVLLQHLSYDPALKEDADVVSSMLTAVRDFIHDSFAGDTGQEVQNLRLGDLEIIVEQSPDTVLALVCRGNTPRALHATMENTIEALQQGFHEPLQDFDGDTSAFTASDELLSPLMLSDYANQNKKSSPIKAIASVALVVFGLIGWMIWDYQQENQQQSNWQAYITHLNQEPGIVLTHIEEDDGIYTVSGLRDPLSADPTALLKQFELDKNNIHYQFQPYHSMQKPMVLKRIAKLIQPPASVELKLEEQILHLSGTAPLSWASTVEQSAQLVLGIEHVDHSKLVEPESLLDRVKRLIQPPKTIRMLFKEGRLTATGKATSAWLTEAKKIISEIEEITSYDDEKVKRLDSPAYLLSLARETLRPPRTVQLSVSKSRQLIAQGYAAKTWLSQARERVKNIAFITAYNEDKLQSTDQIILQRARKVLTPPASITLSLSGSTLIATGKSTKTWVGFARLESLNIKGVSAFKDQTNKIITDDDILHAAINFLKPPASVTLNFSQGVLHASGSSPEAWIKKAEKQFMKVEGIHSFYTSQLRNISSAWNNIKDQIKVIQLSPTANKEKLTSDDKNKLNKLALLYKNALKLDETSVIYIHGTYSDNDKLNAGLRLYLIRDVLIKHGITASNIINKLTSNNQDNQTDDLSFSLVTLGKH